MSNRLETRLGEIVLKNPVMPASGTFGFGLENLWIDAFRVIFRVVIEAGTGCPIVHTGIARLHKDGAIGTWAGEVTVLPLHQLTMDVFIVRSGGYLR